MAKKSTGKIAFGALVGVCIGYVVGVFTAPKSGKDSRQYVKEKAGTTYKTAEKLLKKTMVELDVLIKKGTERAKQTKDKAKQDLTKAVNKAKQTKQKIRELISAIHEGEADDKDLDRAVNDGKNAIEHLKKFVNKK